MQHKLKLHNSCNTIYRTSIVSLSIQLYIQNRQLKMNDYDNKITELPNYTSARVRRHSSSDIYILLLLLLLLIIIIINTNGVGFVMLYSANAGSSQRFAVQTVKNSLCMFVCLVNVIWRCFLQTKINTHPP
jgi:hypothetical protein